MSKAYIEIGRLKKTYGQKGELRYVLFDGYKDVLERVGHFFVQLDSIYVPFFPVTKFDLNANTLRIQGIGSEKEAEKLTGKHIFMDTSEINEEGGQETVAEFEVLVGYVLYDQNDQKLGRIEEIRVFPMQELGVLDNGKMIPLNTSLILEINKDEKRLNMDLPEGILDI